jgi:hypothetical protein
MSKALSMDLREPEAMREREGRHTVEHGGECLEGCGRARCPPARFPGLAGADRPRDDRPAQPGREAARQPHAPEIKAIP